MDKKIILLIILSLFLFVAKAGINLVNVYPANEKIEVLEFIGSSNLYGRGDRAGDVLCDLHYPVLACTWVGGYYSDSSTYITIFNLIDNSSFKINLNEMIGGLLIYFNQEYNTLRVYYITQVASSYQYQLKYFNVFMNNSTSTTPTTILSLTSNSNYYYKMFYYAKDYSILYIASGERNSGAISIFLNKTNGYFTYNTHSASDTITVVGNYIFYIPCYRSTSGNYDITVYNIFFTNPKNIYNHYTYTNLCYNIYLRSYVNFAIFGTFSHDTTSKGFTYIFTDFLYKINRKYLSDTFMKIDSSLHKYSYFYNLLIRASETFLYNGTNYNIAYVFEEQKICKECGIMVLNSANNIVVLKVRKNTNIQGFYVDLLFNEDFYYNTTSQTSAYELVLNGPNGNIGNIVLNFFNNNTYKTYIIGINLDWYAFTSGKFIYFEKANHENVSITVSFQNTNLAPAHLYPLSSQNFLINPRSSNLVYFNLQNVQDCENYIINILGVPLGFNNYVFFRNNKFDFSCRAMIFLRPFDRIYKIIVYDKNGNKVYETGGFYVTQSEYFIRINNQGSGGGTINIEDINITYSCNTYNINETHAKHSCSVIANKQVNIRYLVKRINMFLNTSNIVCDYQTNGDIVAFECEIDKSKNYNVLLYTDNNIIYSDFITFQSSNNIGFTNQENLIIVLFFILVLGLITAFNPVLGLFTISVGLFILYFVGFLSINIIGLSSLVFLFAVLIYLFRHKLIYGE